MASLIDVVTRAASEQITGHVTVPARAARFGTWKEWVPESVRAALAQIGASEPWIHQVQAADAVEAGKNVVVATGTGSGKSLAAWVPALSRIENAREARSSLASVKYRPTVLYLAPTKALAADQEHNLTDLAKLVNPRIGIATIDGDAEGPTRTWARDYADIILTNPDFAHHAMLASQQRWNRLWRGLSLIVIDEFHSYRGIFGSNVALIVRRMLRVARHYGAHPQVVFLSATSGDPAASAKRFLGEAFGPVIAVTDDGSPSGARDILTLQCREIPDDAGSSAVLTSGPAPGDSAVLTSGPAPGDDLWHVGATHSIGGTGAQAGPDASELAAVEAQISAGNTEAAPEDALAADVKRRAANTEAGELTALLVANDARALTFVRSRPGTERVAEVAHEKLAQTAPHLEGTVAAYRGGYLPEERRELERRLRSGDLRALATTSALELGIDIAGLDAVVVTGWPGTHASFQQQVGRAGRAGTDGLALFIGRDNPLDQYILANPSTLVETPAEVTVFDPANPWILPGHICAAAAELPLVDSDAAIFSLQSPALFEQMADAEMLKKRPTGYFWNPAMRTNPHGLVDIRGGGTTISIIDADDGALLGTVDAGRADTTVHPGAIYIHQGVPFEVESLDDEIALVHKHREEEIRTYPREETSVEILHTEEEREFIDGSWCRGSVIVRSRVVGYDIRRVRDGMYLGMVPLQMPMREFETGGVWLTIDESATREAGIATADLPGALHGAEHTMIALLPLFATCDRWDLGGLSTAVHPQTGKPTIIVHDAIAGGSGCAERGFSSGIRWLHATLDTLESCPCDTGCPRCVQSPKCGNNNSPLSKDGARKLLTLLTRNFPNYRQPGDPA